MTVLQLLAQPHAPLSPAASAALVPTLLPPQCGAALMYRWGRIHGPPAHVTVLMLKNALVNINRPGWQDKFAFMPEEEKTSISLTQKRHYYCSGGGRPSEPPGVTSDCVGFSLSLDDDPGG